MKLFKRIQEGETITAAVFAWKIQKYTDANVFRLSVYLKIITFRFEIGIPNGKKPDIL